MISYESILKVSRVLERHDVLFYKLWDMGVPSINKQIKTARVCFNKNGNLVSFEFNPKYWNKLSNYERAFVIAHESLHVILNHGKRIFPKTKEEHKTANVAMDIAVNEMLLGGFYFERDIVLKFFIHSIRESILFFKHPVLFSSI